MPKPSKRGTWQRKNAPERVTGGLVQPPTWIAPCIPKLVRSAPSGADWLHEIKHDGYRAVSVLDHGETRIFTRRGLDWSARMPGIARALASLKVRSAVIDGEVVMVGEDGLPDFFRLHAALAKGSAPDAVLLAFDAMHLNGEDVRQSPLTERRNILLSFLGKASPWLQFSHEIGGEGAAAFRAASDMGLEGIVSKRRSSPYRSGKTDAWCKVKCTMTEHFAVVGFDPWGAYSLRSLKLARLVEGALISCGSAGSSLSIADARISAPRSTRAMQWSRRSNIAG